MTLSCVLDNFGHMCVVGFLEEKKNSKFEPMSLGIGALICVVDKLEKNGDVLDTRHDRLLVCWLPITYSSSNGRKRNRQIGMSHTHNTTAICENTYHSGNTKS